VDLLRFTVSSTSIILRQVAFLFFKSIIDALDGELSRVKNTPSYTGRYLDSVFDILLNFLFLLAVSHVA